MTFEQISGLLLAVPPVLWTLFQAHRSRRANRFVINIFGTLLLMTFCIPGFAAQQSSAAAEALAQALGGLSDTDLKQRRCCL